VFDSWLIVTLAAHQDGHGSVNGKKSRFCVLNSTSLQQHARLSNTSLSFLRFQKRQETRAKERMVTEDKRMKCWNGLSIVHTSVIQKCFI